ncbi:hypothetical protein M422DRAFT_264806 [Sphaerobolus stellatus SS14]|uniref:Uncharacterized protein n=1 Tax=Sphaerobolus stellatus (strain SS14) TaxID=990650 RepID=A0A0C9V741_SPHS4|nr:hypothetical protein M422DRAFT_264806 [Sphaerobolus stellatus SS14]
MSMPGAPGLQQVRYLAMASDTENIWGGISPVHLQNLEFLESDEYDVWLDIRTTGKVFVFGELEKLELHRGVRSTTLLDSLSICQFPRLKSLAINKTVSGTSDDYIELHRIQAAIDAPNVVDIWLGGISCCGEEPAEFVKAFPKLRNLAIEAVRSYQGVTFFKPWLRQLEHMCVQVSKGLLYSTPGFLAMLWRGLSRCNVTI